MNSLSDISTAEPQDQILGLSEKVCAAYLMCWLQITDGVKPTLSELEKFEDQPEGIDLEVVTESGMHHYSAMQLC